MNSLDVLQSKDAAEKLGVNESRIRALAKHGQLNARKLGDRWVFDPSAVERRLLSKPQRGRPLEPANAWGLLFLASGEPAPWLSAVARSRMRRLIRLESLPQMLSRAGKRAVVHYLAGSDSARNKLMRDPHFVRSGLSAAKHYAMDIYSPKILEGYLPAKDFRHFMYEQALRSVDERDADLIIHEVPGLWPFPAHRIAPKAVVAADLMESLDARTRRAGLAALRRRSPK
jgi:hypothetical protein